MHGNSDVLMLTNIICSLVCLAAVSKLNLFSLLPSHPGIELHYSNPANDVDGIHGYVILKQMQTSLSNVPMPPPTMQK